MTVTARAEIIVPANVEKAFAAFVDYSTWKAWMPGVFWPLKGPARALQAGDTLAVRVGGRFGLPSALKVKRVVLNREICWSGGVLNLLHAEHAFLFEPMGDAQTRIQSIEAWTGVLPNIGPIAARVVKAASDGGQKMLAGFARFVV